MDEVQEYFKLPHENFDTCDSLQWWAGRHSQFPNLSRFAWDILSIPGKFATDFFSLFGCLVMFLSLPHSNQDPLLLLNIFFLEAMIQFLSTTQASSQRQSEP
jgi:hypothetical protein